MSYTNIENLVSLWDLITLEFIYGQKKCIKESFIINTKTNNYAQQFLRLDTESTTIMIVSHLEDPGNLTMKLILRVFYLVFGIKRGCSSLTRKCLIAFV